MGEWEGRFWVANLPWPTDRQGEALTIHFPTGRHRQEYGARPGTLGRQAFSLTPGVGKGNNFWLGEPASPWIGLTGPQRAGMVLLLDGAYLEDLYACVPAHAYAGKSLATCEMLYGPLLLKPSADDQARDQLGIPPLVGAPDPGKPWQTRIELLPSADLGEGIVGATDGLVCGARFGEKDVTVVATAAAARDLAATVALRNLKPDETISLGKLAARLKPGVPESARFDLKTPIAASAVLEVRVEAADGKTVALCLPRFKDPADFNGYKEPPAIARKTDFEPVLKMPTVDEGVISPHVAWMKPLRKKPRILMIVPRNARRDVCELKQRLDAEIDLCVVAFPHYFVYGDLAAALESDPFRLMPRLLAKSHDLIVIPSGLCWNILTEEFRAAIVAKVQGGTGLLYVSPTLGDHFGKPQDSVQKEILTECPSLAGVAERLVLGVPSQSIPVLNETPLSQRLRAGTCGKGRVVLLNLPIWPYGKPYLVTTAVTPCVTMKQQAGVAFRFTEYHWLLALRAMAWAAGTDLPIAIDLRTATAANRSLMTSLALDNQVGREIAGAVQLRWLNRDGDEIAQATRKLRLAIGPNQVELVADKCDRLLPGTVLSEAILRDGDGFVIGCGAGETRLDQEPRLGAVTLRKFAHEPAEAVQGAVMVQGQMPPQATLALAVFDMQGRLLAQFRGQSGFYDLVSK